MIRQGMDLGAYRMPWSGFDIGFTLARWNEKGDREYAATIEWAAVPPNATMEPSFRLPEERAQRLMDMLWDAGLRPTQGHQSEGTTNAQAAHLADMRAIAFAKLSIPEPVKYNGR